MMKKLSPLLFLMAAALPAGAASSLSEDFSGMALPANLTESGGAPTYSGSDATFGGNSRYYLHTNELDYGTVDFIAEGTVTLTSVNPNSTAFFGMGPGDPDPAVFNTPTAPSIFAEIAPSAFANGFVRYNDSGGAVSGNGGLNDQGGAWGSGSVHRIRLTWTAADQIAVMELDQDYDGVTFVPDFTATYDGSTTSVDLDSSDNGFDATNSGIFFGGGNGSAWDDISVTVATGGPPNISVPASVTLNPDGTVQQYNVTVANTSADNALEVDPVAFIGTDFAAFSVVTTLPLTVAASSSETLTFEFDPTGLSGAVSATMRLTSNDPDDSPKDITISGVVQDPVIVLSETSLDFGSVAGTDPAVDLPLDIDNDGANEGLTIAATAISGPGAAAFSVETAPTSPVAPAGTVQMMVRYDPSVISGRSVALLTIESNDPLTPSVVVTLTGVTPLSPGTFSDDFATYASPDWDNPWDVDYSNGRADFAGGANADRNYLRTVAANFNRVDFTATADLHRTGGGGIGSIFFGIGNGETPPDANTAAPWGEPATGEYIYLRLRGTGWTDELADVNANASGTTVFGLANSAIGDDVAAQMVFVAETGTVTITLDIDGNGFDGADPAVSASNPDLSGSDSHIFVGGAGGVWADNVVVTVGGGAPLQLKVTQIPDDMLRFTWNSRAGKIYNLLSNTALDPDPSTWSPPVLSGITATPDTNMLEIARPPGDVRRFYVIEEMDAPPILSEDFESGASGWTIGSDGVAGTAWELDAPSVVGPQEANSPTKCYATNISANYGRNANVWLRSPSVDLTALASATLEFWQFRDMDFVGDAGTVRILDASDDSELAVITTVDDFAVVWEKLTFALPAAAFTVPIKLEFRFVSDSAIEYPGWYIDDVMITAP